jgi:UDP-MurNAc hydroxylase
VKNYVNFLNHSCIELVAPNTTILCDPWFSGTAFVDGWSLLHDKSHDINNLSFDYIWISHEHPDHFSIPTINSLQSPAKFLFQETKDKKVKNFLESKGHKVIELANKKPTQKGDLELTCVICDGYDSSLVVKFPNGRIVVNINDVRVDINDHINTELKPFLERCGVDLLSFQFGYANWAGNKGDKKIPQHQQELIDKKNMYAIKELNPKMIMPFASFIYFSHEENFYWNEEYWLDHVCSKFLVTFY